MANATAVWRRSWFSRCRCNHDLRHTWATLALAAGVDVKIVSERLVHASAKIAWDIYQHVTPTQDAAETVARLIFGPSE